jgi:hypothetical protein
MLGGYPPFFSEDGDEDLFRQIMAGEFEFHSPFWDPISDGKLPRYKEMEM